MMLLTALVLCVPYRGGQLPAGWWVGGCVCVGGGGGLVGGVVKKCYEADELKPV